MSITNSINLSDLSDKNNTPIKLDDILKLSDGRIGIVIEVNAMPAILFKNEQAKPDYRIFLDKSLSSNSLIVKKPEPI